VLHLRVKAIGSLKAQTFLPVYRQEWLGGPLRARKFIEPAARIGFDQASISNLFRKRRLRVALSHS
jgi:hypothetical protein